MSEKSIFSDSTGKICTAKTVYVVFTLVIAARILLDGVVFDALTPEKIAAYAGLLTVLGGVYGWRNQTKAQVGEVKT